MGKQGRSLGAFLTPSRPQLPAAQQPPTCGGPALRPAGDAHEPRAWDGHQAVHTSTFLFDTEDDAPRGGGRDAPGQTRDEPHCQSAGAAHLSEPPARGYGSYSEGEQPLPGSSLGGNSLGGGFAPVGGGTREVRLDSFGGDADPGGHDACDDDEDEDDDDDAPNFDALLCLTTGDDREAEAAAAAAAAAVAAELADASPLIAVPGDADDEPGDAYALDQGDEPLWSPPPRVASQDSDRGGCGLDAQAGGAAPSARLKRRPRSMLRLDSDSSDHGGGGTQEDLPCGWADRGGANGGQPPAKRAAARQPLAQVQPVPLKRLGRRSDEDDGQAAGGGALPAAAPPKRRGRAIVSDSSDGGEEDDMDDVEGEDDGDDDDLVIADGSGDDEEEDLIHMQPASWGKDGDEEEDGQGDGSEEDPIELLDDDDDDMAAGGAAAAPLALPAWRARLPHFTSVGDIEARRFVLDGAPVYIDYRRQFTGASASRLPAGAAGAGPSKKAAAPRKKKAAAHPDGHWVTERGRKVFVTPTGQRLKGNAAYQAWQEAGGK